MPEPEFDVVVVGAGPAGLVTAITLGRAGVRCLVVERRTRPLPLPRATLASLRSMELMRAWGLEEAVRAGGDQVAFRMAVASTLADLDRHEVVAVGVPSVEQSAWLSPTTPACVPQDHLETVLLEQARALPSVTVATGVEATLDGHDGSGVRVRLHELASGRSRVQEARYLVGADGSHGRLRHHLGIGAVSSGSLHESVTAVVRAPLWELVGRHRYLLYAVDGPRTGGTFLPAGAGDRWIFALEWDPQTERLTDYGERRVVDLVRTAAGAPALPVRVERVGAFSFVAELADRFRSGRVFLVGDAAHRVTPRGGTGMNTAIGSAYNLAWKLAWVLNGWAGTELLDTYETERRPVVEHNLARSIDPAGSRRDPLDEVRVDLGGRIGHHWVGGGAGRRSTLDLIDPHGLTLLTGPDGSGWRARVAAAEGSAPVSGRPLDASSAMGLGVGRAGAALVRPDGVALWITSEPADGVGPMPAHRAPAWRPNSPAVPETG